MRTRAIFGLLTLVIVVLCATAATAADADAATRDVDFAQEILPVLRQRCFSCHGPEKQKADLRLDRRSAILKGGESGPALEPGDPGKSRILQRVTDPSPDQVMPPKGERLTETQVSALRTWIQQGAVWPKAMDSDDAESEKHWSFQPVQRPKLDVPSGSMGGVVDALVLAKLDAAGIRPSAEASRTTLIRRLYLVMLGVPPSPDEVEAFASDPDPRAYERLVDKVLADARYGERWGRHWLDVIRFAESNGFETNRERPNAWRFRDYVIEAFNRDVPFNRFIREQIAGDTMGVDVATGFLVAGPVDIVGSPDPVLTAQQRADELDDMVNTTGTAFLGLTLGCARCHNHKFDPIEQREYYGMVAMFSGVKHGERALPQAPDRKAAVANLDRRMADLESRLAPFEVKETDVPTNSAVRPPVNFTLNEETFAPIETRSVRFTILETTGAEPCIDEIEIFSGGKNVALAGAGVKASASGTLPGFEIHRLEHIHDGQTGNNRSWISNEPGKGWVQLDLPKTTSIERIVWSRDRSGQYKDRLATKYRVDVIDGTGAWRTIASSDDRAKFAGDTKPAEKPPRRYRLENLPDAQAAEARGWLTELEAVKKRRTTLATPEMIYSGTFTEPKPTYRLHRGDPMQKREEVVPATLSVFRPQRLEPQEGEVARRQKLADWIADDANPLTARVLVNRIWQHHFGVGLVDTPNDFGRNGSRPTHPELLDWLASELVENGWSVKAIQRRILLSATWRQASTPRVEAIRIDAASRLLWRFPPRRLEAEAIRDGVLHVSGALDSTRGGPSFHLHDVDRENVYHYHPKDEFGPAEFRRMVYAYKVRMEQDAIFGSFDCPDGSLVVPRRSVSTTALQALNLFNSRFVMRQAEVFAKRLERQAGADTRRQVREAWRLAYQRVPGERETDEATDFVNRSGLVALGRAIFNSNEFLFIP